MLYSLVPRESACPSIVTFVAGQRRSHAALRSSAAREYLVSLGIAADRLVAVSKGEEQPFCREETEACWAQNRRGYFVITGK